MIDALRADRLSCYGNPRPTSPAIDALAAQGILFEQAMAQCSFTPPAMASILTGRYVPAHGLLGWESRLAPAETTLAEVLSSEGFRTAAFVYLNLLSRQGLSDGFQAGEEMVEDAERLTRLAREWIEKDSDAPFFLLLHCYDVHRPYTPPAPYDTLFDPGYAGGIAGDNETLDAIRSGARAISAEDARHLAALYDGEIRRTDEILGRFVAWLEEGGLLDRTLLVVTSDHGEMLDERPEPLLRYTHDPSLYDGVMRIPLILRGPGLPRGARVRAQVREIDIMPTVLALLGVPAPGGVHGVALVGPGGTPRGEDLPAFADVYPEPTRPERYLRALRVPGRKVIHETYRGAWQAFDLAADPGETRNLWDARGEAGGGPAESETGAGGEAGGAAAAGQPEAGGAAVAGFDSLAAALLAHTEEMGELHEICVAWVGRDGESVEGSVAVRGGRVLEANHPPGVRDPEVSLSADGARATFRAASGPTPSVLWFRVSPPGVHAEVEVRDGSGAPLPITVHGRAGTFAGHAAFWLPEIGHALLNPFENPARGAYVFGRARLAKQRVTIKPGPEEIERLKALGYVGG